MDYESTVPSVLESSELDNGADEAGRPLQFFGRTTYDESDTDNACVECVVCGAHWLAYFDAVSKRNLPSPAYIACEGDCETMLLEEQDQITSGTGLLTFGQVHERTKGGVLTWHIRDRTLRVGAEGPNLRMNGPRITKVSPLSSHSIGAEESLESDSPSHSIERTEYSGGDATGATSITCSVCKESRQAFFHTMTRRHVKSPGLFACEDTCVNPVKNYMYMGTTARGGVEIQQESEYYGFLHYHSEANTWHVIAGEASESRVPRCSISDLDNSLKKSRNKLPQHRGDPQTSFRSSKASKSRKWPNTAQPMER